MLVKYMVEGRLEYECMTKAYVLESSVPNSSKLGFLRKKTRNAMNSCSRLALEPRMCPFLQLEMMD